MMSSSSPDENRVFSTDPLPTAGLGQAGVREAAAAAPAQHGDTTAGPNAGGRATDPMKRKLSSGSRAEEPTQTPDALSLAPNTTQTAVAQLYVLCLTGSPPSREIPLSCRSRLSVPCCPFSRKSFPLGRMRGAGWAWQALAKAGYGLGAAPRGSGVKSSF